MLPIKGAIPPPVTSSATRADHPDEGSVGLPSACHGSPGAVCPADVRGGDGAHHGGRGRVAGSARDPAGEGYERWLPGDPPASLAGAPGSAVAGGAAPRRGDGRAEAGRQSPRSQGGRTSPAPAAGQASAAARGAGCVVAGPGAALARGTARAGVAASDVQGPRASRRAVTGSNPKASGSRGSRRTSCPSSTS